MGEGRAVVRATSTSEPASYDAYSITVDFLPAVYFQLGEVGQLDGVLGFKAGVGGFGTLEHGTFPLRVPVDECSVNNTETNRFVLKANSNGSNVSGLTTTEAMKFYNLDVLVIKWQFTDETLVSPLMYWADNGYYSESPNDEFYAKLQSHVGEACALFIEEFKDLQALSIDISGNKNVLAPNVEKLIGTITYEGGDKLSSDNHPDLFTWSSSNEEIAVVDDYGNIKPQDLGNATITCKKSDNSDLSTDFDITTSYSDGKYFEMYHGYSNPTMGYLIDVVGEFVEEDSTLLNLHRCTASNAGLERFSFSLSNGKKLFGLDEFEMTWQLETFSRAAPILTWDTDRYYATVDDPNFWGPIFDRRGERCQIYIRNTKTDPDDVISVEIVGVPTMGNTDTQKLTGIVTYGDDRTTSSETHPAIVQWYSSDEDIAIIDMYGNVVPMGVGQTTVRCTSSQDSNVFIEHVLTIEFIPQHYFTVVGSYDPISGISGYDADSYLGSLEGSMQDGIKPISLYVQKNDSADKYLFGTRNHDMFYGLDDIVIQWQYDHARIGSPKMSWNYSNYVRYGVDDDNWSQHRHYEPYSGDVYIVKYSVEEFEQLKDGSPHYDYYYLYDGDAP